MKAGGRARMWKRERYAVDSVWGFLFNYLPLLPRRQILRIESAFLRTVDQNKSRIDCM